MCNRFDISKFCSYFLFNFSHYIILFTQSIIILCIFNLNKTSNHEKLKSFMINKAFKRSKLRVLLIFSSGSIYPCKSTAINIHLCYSGLIIAAEEYLRIIFYSKQIQQSVRTNKRQTSIAPFLMSLSCREATMKRQYKREVYIWTEFTSFSYRSVHYSI